MESTDSTLDRVTTSLDQISTTITGLDQRQAQLQSTISEIPREEGVYTIVSSLFHISHCAQDRQVLDKQTNGQTDQEMLE